MTTITQFEILSNENSNKQINIDDIINSGNSYIELWTNLKCGNVLFDSNKYNWSIYSSSFNRVIINKSNLLFLIEDEDGEIFGYYLSTQVPQDIGRSSTDFNSFHFNLKSKDNRLKYPIKFEIKHPVWGGICLYDENEKEYLINLGNIVLCKKENKDKSYCHQYNEGDFDYHGIGKALCGKTDPEFFKPTRIVVIQMEDPNKKSSDNNNI